MTGHSKAIEVFQLWKSFDGRMVLREINLQIGSGECVALMGSNGAGKTTLLRCLSAIVRPTAGKVHWFGRPAAARCQQRRLVGMVAHESHLYGHLTVRENLLFAARMCAVDDPASRTESLLVQCGLQGSAEQRVQQISKGLRQRLALCRAWIHEPPILLLDEPFSGLDTASCDWLATGLMDARDRGRTICFATHNDEHSRRIADRTLVLRGGRMAEQSAESDNATRRETCRAAA